MDADEWFELVRASKLVNAKALSNWRQKFAQCFDGESIAAMMVRDKLLTAWQSKNLLARRWKGFFVDQYCIRNRLDSDLAMGVLVLEAMDLQFGEVVILEVIPPTRIRRKDGRPMYSVRESGAGD